MTTHEPEISEQLEFNFPELPPLPCKGRRRRSKAKTCLVFPADGLSKENPLQGEAGEMCQGVLDLNH